MFLIICDVLFKDSNYVVILTIFCSRELLINSRNQLRDVIYLHNSVTLGKDCAKSRHDAFVRRMVQSWQ